MRKVAEYSLAAFVAALVFASVQPELTKALAGLSAAATALGGR